MNIILGAEAAEKARERYTVLELDSFRIQGHPDTVQAYCVIEHIPLEELALTDSMVALHQDLINHYRQRRWQYCLDAIEHLQGRWRGELDTFYDTMCQRIQGYIQNEPEGSWDGSVSRTETAAA